MPRKSTKKAVDPTQPLPTSTSSEPAAGPIQPPPTVDPVKNQVAEPAAASKREPVGEKEYDYKTGDRPFHAIDPKQVNHGHLMAIVQYVNVRAIDKTYSGDLVAHLEDLDTGLKWDRRGADLIGRMLSSDVYHETKKVTRTDLANILMTSFNRPLTVCFITDDAMKAAIKADIKPKDAEKRVLRGRYLKEGELGRAVVEDLDLDKGTRPGERIRLVDTRTIQYLIVDGVRYEPK